MLTDLLSGVKRLPAECIINLGGEQQEMSDLYAALIEVTVDANRSRQTTATMVLESRRLEDGTWTVQDDERFRPWTPIYINAVFGDEIEEVMRGYVKEVRAEYPEDQGAAKVTVTCQDHSLLMNRTFRERRWGEDTPTTDIAVAKDIVSQYVGDGLSLQSTLGETGQTVQDLLQNKTDIQFLKERARACGFEMIFYQGELYFGPMRLSGDDHQPAIMLYAGTDTNCLSFNLTDDGHRPDSLIYQVPAEIGSTDQPTVVQPNLELLGSEPADSTWAGLSDFTWRPQRQGVTDEAQMQAITQQMANEQSMKIKVEGELDGSLYGHVLLVGKTVGVDGTGERYDGVYYVDAARHRFDSNGYRIAFTLLRNAYGDNLAGASNPLAGVM